MLPFRYAVPGALRIRTLQPLPDRDGACSLVYDVERGAVFEVPEELRLHVAEALERGNYDEELWAWLGSADLLTAEAAAPPALPLPQGAPGRPVSFLRGKALAGGADEAHAWIDQPEPEAALEAVANAFRRGAGSPRVKLHLGWLGSLPAWDLLDLVVAEARSHASRSGQDLACELTLYPEQVTPEVAARLAGRPVHVRLRCGEVDPLAGVGTLQEGRPWLLAGKAVALLLAQTASRRAAGCPGPSGDPELSGPLAPLVRLGPLNPLREIRWPLPLFAPLPDLPRLTVQCILDGPARLAELWRWAQGTGVRCLDAIRLEASLDTAPGPSAWERGCLTAAARTRGDYREDLHAICEEICAELEYGRLPIDFQPLTRIVRRLVRSEAAAPAGRCDAGMNALDPRFLPEQMWVRLQGPAGPEAPAPRCEGCWARQVCSHSAFVASPLGKEDPRKPSLERCGFWSAEVEVAARLHHRLAAIDPVLVRRFLGSPVGMEDTGSHGWLDPGLSELQRFGPS